MLPTKSDLKVARTQIILTAISVATTTIYLIISMWGFGFPNMDLLINFLRFSLGAPFQSTTMSVVFGYISLFDAESFPTWFRIASAIGVLGYVLNVGIMVNSNTGSRVKRYKQISGTGYLMGTIGSIVGITAILNTMTFWFAGYILMILSFGFTIKTYKQIKTSLVTYGEGQARAASEGIDEPVATNQASSVKSEEPKE